MEYIILSLKHTRKASEPTFWRAKDAGYVNSPFAAGHYSEEQVKANHEYYNNGIDSIAVPITEAGMESIGFKCSIDFKKIKECNP